MSLSLLLPVLGEVLDRVLPDPKQAEQVKLEMLKMAQEAELKGLQASVELAKGQIEVNKVEAGTDGFRGGWRPFCGWVCGAGLCYQFLVQPILPWLVGLQGATVPPLPPIDSEALYGLLMGLLGLGGLRTVERVRGKV
jgi:hypothetical protein